MERHILKERTSSCPISSSGSQEVPTLAPLCKPYRHRRPNSLISCVSLARLSILGTGFPFGYTPVGPDNPDTLPSPNQNVTAGQSTRGNKEQTENSCHMLYNTIE